MFPGPGCIKQLKIKSDLMQLFAVFQKIFYTGIVLALLFYLPSADLSIIACKENFQNARNDYRKSHVILGCFMHPGPDH